MVNTPTCTAPCDGTVTVFPGSGAAYFSAGKKYTIGMHGAAIAAADINGDGIIDLVVTNATAGDNADTSVLLGTTGGGFQAAKNYTLGSLSSVAYLVDMNRDGKLDLVEAGGVALGKGDGTFGHLSFPIRMEFGRPRRPAPIPILAWDTSTPTRFRMSRWHISRRKTVGLFMN